MANKLKIEKVAKFFLFGLKVMSSGFFGLDFYWDTLYDLEAGVFEGLQLVGII